jgi:hypothetical protein
VEKIRRRQRPVVQGRGVVVREFHALCEVTARTPKMNETIEKALNDEPLLIFSFYTVNQIGTLQSLGNEITEMLNASITVQENGEIRFEKFTKLYGLFWLWTLGAYEVIHTMASAKGCFLINVRQRLEKLSKKLAKIRAPFAKQKISGLEIPTPGEPSVSGIDGKKKDISFFIQGETYWARSLINEFSELVKSIRREDVLMSFPDYIRSKNRGKT